MFDLSTVCDVASEALAAVGLVLALASLFIAWGAFHA